MWMVIVRDITIAMRKLCFKARVLCFEWLFCLCDVLKEIRASQKHQFTIHLYNNVEMVQLQNKPFLIY